MGVQPTGNSYNNQQIDDDLLTQADVDDGASGPTEPSYTGNQNSALRNDLGGQMLKASLMPQLVAQAGPETHETGPEPDPKDLQGTVTVGQDDMLSELADKYHVSQSEIIRANPGKEAQLEAIQNYPSKGDLYNTMVGQTLNIPKPESAWDRTADAFHFNFKSKGDRELDKMNDIANTISQPDAVDHNAGPTANWSQQERMNFARTYMQMTEKGETLGQIVGEHGASTAASHIFGELAAGGMELEKAALPMGLALDAAGHLVVSSMAQTVANNKEYNMARDLDTLRQEVQQNGPGVLNEDNLLNDGRFMGKLASSSSAGDPKPYVAALLIMYQGTFGEENTNTARAQA